MTNLPASIDQARTGLNTLAAETANIADVVAMAFGLPLAEISGGSRDLPGAVAELAGSLGYVASVCSRASAGLVQMRIPRSGEVAHTIYGPVSLPALPAQPLVIKLDPPAEDGTAQYLQTPAGWVPTPAPGTSQQDDGPASGEEEIVEPPLPAPAEATKKPRRRSK